MINNVIDYFKSIDKLERLLWLLIVPIIIIECFLFNWITPKAYSGDEVIECSFSSTDNNPNYGSSVDIVLDTNNNRNIRSIFVTDSEFLAYVKDQINGNNSNFGDGILLVENGGYMHSYWSGTSNNFNAGNINTATYYAWQYLDSHEQAGLYPNLNVIYIAYDYRGNIGYNNEYLNTLSFKNDIEYVSSIEDMKKYLIDGDNSVVNTGDPNVIPEVSGSVPTPQKVKILDDGSNPAISWTNPKTVNKIDGINIEIKWKPALNLSYGADFKDTVLSEDFFNVYSGSLADSMGVLYDCFCIPSQSNTTFSNVLNGFNTLFDTHYVFDIDPSSDYDKSYVKFVINQDSNIHLDLYPYGVGNPPSVTGGSTNNLVGGAIDDKKSSKKNNTKNNQDIVGGDWADLAQNAISTLKGVYDTAVVANSDFMIRYYYMNNGKKVVSDWVDAKREFDNNSKPKDDTNISFRDNENNPISNPSYLPADTSVTSTNSSAWWETFFNTTDSAVDKLDDSMNILSDDVESGGFFAFFRQLFDEFPVFYGMLSFGLILAIILRVLGR